VAQGLNAHAPEKHGAEWRRWLGSSRSWNWTGGRKGTAVTRSLRARERGSDSSESQRDARKKTKGMGSTPPQAVLFIGGPPNLSVAVPSIVQCASTALSRELCTKIQADFSLRPKSEFRSSAKKTTSGRPDGKSFCKPPRHINISLWQIILPNRPST
jgi:hypothetical protein